MPENKECPFIKDICRWQPSSCWFRDQARAFYIKDPSLATDLRECIKTNRKLAQCPNWREVCNLLGMDPTETEKSNSQNKPR